MTVVTQIFSLAAGAGPAFALLYYTLRNYTYPAVEKPFFEERKVFMFFALGIVIGMIVFAFEDWGDSYAVPELAMVLILGFAVMEELMKFVILNFPKFQRRVDTAFCGVSLGLGIAATFTFATIYVFLIDVGKPQAVDFVAGALLGFMFTLLHGSTTALVGLGVARGEGQAYLIEAILIHLGFAFFYQSFFAIELIPPPMNLIGLGIAAAIVVWAYRRIYVDQLPTLIKDAKRLLAQGKMKA